MPSEGARWRIQLARTWVPFVGGICSIISALGAFKTTSPVLTVFSVLSGVMTIAAAVLPGNVLRSVYKGIVASVINFVTTWPLIITTTVQRSQNRTVVYRGGVYATTDLERGFTRRPFQMRPATPLIFKRTRMLMEPVVRPDPDAPPIIIHVTEDRLPSQVMFSTQDPEQDQRSETLAPSSRTQHPGILLESQPLPLHPPGTHVNDNHHSDSEDDYPTDFEDHYYADFEENADVSEDGSQHNSRASLNAEILHIAFPGAFRDVGWTLLIDNHTRKDSTEIPMIEKCMTHLKGQIISLNWVLRCQDALRKRTPDNDLCRVFDIAFQPDPHPHNPNGRYQPGARIWDMQRREYLPDQVVREHFEQPASSHCTLYKMHIIVSANPEWSTVVERRRGIRCLDVFRAVYDMLQKPLTRRELGMIPPGSLRYCEDAQNARIKDTPVLEEAERRRGILRIDSFVNYRFFQGLAQKDDVWMLDTCNPDGKPWHFPQPPTPA